MVILWLCFLYIRSVLRCVYYCMIEKRSITFCIFKRISQCRICLKNQTERNLTVLQQIICLKIDSIFKHETVTVETWKMNFVTKQRFLVILILLAQASCLLCLPISYITNGSGFQSKTIYGKENSELLNVIYTSLPWYIKTIKSSNENGCTPSCLSLDTAQKYSIVFFLTSKKIFKESFLRKFYSKKVFNVFQQQPFQYLSTFQFFSMLRDCS